ncbi:MAG TPA: murein biosynthesis integral membrane protein MurJ [Aquifex aeolicus]|nr:murein biosynthesis integral membrane protein MurJ [Aquifex aeolicus]
MRLVRFALSFAFGTLISRVLGFVRDASVAYFFGASPISDAFFVAFRIPNSLRRLLGEGGFNAAFVPLYSRAVSEGRDGEFLGRVLVLYAFANALITLVGVTLAEYIVSLVAPGLRGGESFPIAVFMTRFLFLYVFLVGMYALFMGVLNARGRFFVPAVSQGVFNGAFVLVLLMTAEELGYVALVFGVLLGGVFQVFMNFPELIGSGVRLKISLGIGEDVKTLFRRLVPAVGGFGVGQLSLFIDTFLASFLGTGAVSYLHYASRLYQLPFGVFSVGVANSLLSLLSHKKSSGSRELTDALGLVIILTAPASLGLILLSDEIVKLIYMRGSFTESDVLTTSGVLSLYALALVPFSLQKVLSAEFFARGDTATPVKVSLISVLVEGISGALLAFGIGMGIYGLPLGTALSSLVALALLFAMKKTPVLKKELLKTIFTVFLSIAPMGAVAVLISKAVEGDALAVGLAIPLSGLTYLAGLVILGERLTLRFLKGFVEKVRQPGNAP